MIALVKEYKSYLKSIPNLLENSDYKLDYFINALNVSKPTMYRKMRENAFTTDEVEIITNLLNPQQNYLKEILDGIEEGRKDYQEGRIYTSEEVKLLIGNKIKDLTNKASDNYSKNL